MQLRFEKLLDDMRVDASKDIIDKRGGAGANSKLSSGNIANDITALNRTSGLLPGVGAIGHGPSLFQTFQE